MLKVFQELHLGGLSTWEEDEEELRMVSELWRVEMQVVLGRALCCEVASQQWWWEEPPG